MLYVQVGISQNLITDHVSKRPVVSGHVVLICTVVDDLEYFLHPLRSKVTTPLSVVI